MVGIEITNRDGSRSYFKAAEFHPQDDAELYKKVCAILNEKRFDDARILNVTSYDRMVSYDIEPNGADFAVYANGQRYEA